MSATTEIPMEPNVHNERLAGRRREATPLDSSLDCVVGRRLAQAGLHKLHHALHNTAMSYISERDGFAGHDRRTSRE